MALGQFLTQNFHYSYFSSYFHKLSDFQTYLDFFRDFVVLVRYCVVICFVWCCLIFFFRIVVVFVCFILKYWLQSITSSINYLRVKVADPDTWLL